MKFTDDGTYQEEAIRNHYNDPEFKTFMHKRQQSNPDLLRWNGLENERRVGIDYYPEEVSGNIEFRGPSSVGVSGTERVYNL